MTSALACEEAFDANETGVQLNEELKRARFM